MSIREREKKERDRLYGELIMDFINAKDPEKAFLTLPSSIQQVFDFSPDFTEEIMRKYPPTSSRPKNFNELDKTLLKALKKRNFYFRKRSSNKQRLLEEKIAFLSKSFSEERFREIRKKACHYDGTRMALKELEGYHEQIRNLIAAVVDGERVYEGNWLRTFFNESRLKVRGPRAQHLVLSENGSIYAEPLFSEDSFFRRGFRKKAFRQVLAYCLAVFFKSPQNRALIRQCEKCQKFFIASKLDKRIKKCKECSGISTKSKEWKKEYMRDYRKKRKIQKDNQGIERKIENYMRNLEITREEALAIIKADSML